MAIYRGVGGAGEANDDATLNAVTEKATDAATSAAEAASSASAAASSASSASTSATNAASSASSASTSASTATTQATNAATSATASAASASAANTSAGTASDEANYAEEWATKAEDSLISTSAGGDGSTDYSSLHHAAKSAASATAAASSASSASTSATTATTKASEASTSATAAASSASAASTSASAASTSATNAATSATAAQTAQAAAEAAQEAIDGTYLGALASDPTVDGNGDAVTTGDWYFNTGSNETRIYNGSTWQVTVQDTSGLVATSGDSMTGNLSFGDNDKAQFGASSDLQIYHDAGGNSFINESGSGSLFIQGDNVRFRTTDGTGTYALFTNGGAVDLYHNNGKKLATTSTGIDVTGTVTADDHVYIEGSAARLSFGESDTTDLNTRFSLQGGSFRVETVNNSFVSALNRIAVNNSTGDISFYEDTGTTAKFFWDASAESLGIGTSSPNNYSGYATVTLNNSSGSEIDFEANGSLKASIFANTAAFYIRSESSIPLVLSTNATERMRIDSSGHLKMTGGGNIVMNNGSGIDFSASEGSGASSSVLDDYEEGTHAPTITASGAGSITLLASSSTLHYTKIGQLVHVSGLLRVDSVSSAAGHIAISLPFALIAESNIEEDVPVGLGFNSTSSGSNVNDFWGIITQGGSVIKIYYANAPAVTSDAADKVTSTTSIRINATYKTAS